MNRFFEQKYSLFLHKNRTHKSFVIFFCRVHAWFPFLRNFQVALDTDSYKNVNYCRLCVRREEGCLRINEGNSLWKVYKKENWVTRWYFQDIVLEIILINFSLHILSIARVAMRLFARPLSLSFKENFNSMGKCCYRNKFATLQ